MRQLFDNLLLSSPNGGGLVLITDNGVACLDTLDTTGIYKCGKLFLRGQQPASLWICGEDIIEITNETLEFDDIHDVLVQDGFIFLVGTQNNEIVKLDQAGAEIERWVFSENDDSYHVNSLAVWNSRIVFSAFGEFQETREYKNKTKGTGFVQDLLSGVKLIDGLSQPHSLTVYGNNILVANSEEMELRLYSPDGNLLQSHQFDGYVRGVYVSDKVIYVGLSKSRNIDTRGVDSATLAVLDAESWDEIGRKKLPVNEIYSVILIDSKSELLNIVARISSYSYNKCSQEVAKNKSLTEVRDKQIAILWKDAADCDASLNSLHQSMSHFENKLEKISQGIEGYRHVIEKCNDRITNLHQIIMYSEDMSIGLQISTLLRSLRNKLYKIRGPYPVGGTVFRLMRQLFRQLPISSRLKSKLRNWVLLRSKLFAGYQASLNHVEDYDNNVDDALDELSSQEKYEKFKSGLARQVERTRTSFVPSGENLLNFNIDTDLQKVASSIIFAEVSNPQVSILIPVYNNIYLTLECLQSIRNSKVLASYEIVIADDASTDQTPEVLDLIGGIKVNRNMENMGFLLNCNEALQYANGEFVVYLNNDVQVSDGWLDGMLDAITTQPNAGAVGPKIIYPSGYLQEAGVALKFDGSADMVGLNDDPDLARYNYTRPVDYCSGACLMVKNKLLAELGGFDDKFAPAYCEDADLCLRIIERGYKVYYTPHSTVVHHLSKTLAADGISTKLQQIASNLVKLQGKWAKKLYELSSVKVIAFYLPQFHTIPENDVWWGDGFTEWTNVKTAQPNYIGHYQPRVPAELGYYDLNDAEVIDSQVELARKYGVDGFCYYYYWFAGKRLLEMPLERMLQTGKPEFPFCLCWANENWSRRWDGRDNEVLIGQEHSYNDDCAVIMDLIRYFKSRNYIRIDGRPLLVIYRVDLFPDFLNTSMLWRKICREEGVGEIYISMVESHDLVHEDIHPESFGCDASIEFPPLNMAVKSESHGKIINPEFHGGIGSYRKTAMRYCTRDLPSYTRFRGVMPDWDNTARRQDNGFCFDNASPEVFQAWMEHVMNFTRQHRHGDERVIFINAWNEWAEGAYLEPDTVNGYSFLEAVKNAKDAERLLLDE